MKLILLLIIVVVGGLSWVEINKAKSEAVTAQVELKAAQVEMKAAKAELSKAQNDLSTALVDIDRLADANAAATAADGERLSKEESETRLIQLKRIYDQHNRDLVAQKAVLMTNRNNLTSELTSLNTHSQKFSEYGSRRNIQGEWVATGVRMSQADRNLAIAKHSEEVNKINFQISAIDGEMLKLEGRFGELETNFAAAVKRVTDVRSF